METDRSPLNSTHVQGNAAEPQNSYPTAWSGRGDATEGGFDPASPDIRVILEQLNNGPTEGGYGAGICFELSAHRSVGVGATIDPATGSLPGHRGRWNLACLEARTRPVFPTVERYFVVAPALALPKEHANVDRWWTETFAAGAMQPAV